MWYFLTGSPRAMTHLVPVCYSRKRSLVWTPKRMHLVPFFIHYGEDFKSVADVWKATTLVTAAWQLCCFQMMSCSWLHKLPQVRET